MRFGMEGVDGQDRRQAGERIQRLVSLPEKMVESFSTLEARPRPDWFAGGDPKGKRLGSGGGTAHLLLSAWKETGQPNGQSFLEWLRSSRKLVIHSGGHSRRLPAYGAAGKVLIPIPVFRWSRGQKLNQTLLDLQLSTYEQVLRQSPSDYRVMITSGDVLLRVRGSLPEMPSGDVLLFGLWDTPENACRFGVCFSPRQSVGDLSFFLQKPDPSLIRELASQFYYLLDTGMWILSEKAVIALMACSGWNVLEEEEPAKGIGFYELYGDFGLSLGRVPNQPDERLSGLKTVVAPLTQAEFYHFGTNRQMIESTTAIQNKELDESKLGFIGANRHPDQYLQNCSFDLPLRLQENHTLWIENSHIPRGWKLSNQHILTGIPDNSWQVTLCPGQCLDMVPVDEDSIAIRPYHINDPFQGELGNAETLWMGEAAGVWLMRRGMTPEMASLNRVEDIQFARLFPVVSPKEITTEFLEWLLSPQPIHPEAFRKFWIECERLSASDLGLRVNMERLYLQRHRFACECLPKLRKNHTWSIFFRLNLEETARLYAKSDFLLPEPLPQDEGADPMNIVHDAMFRGAVLRHRQRPGWERFEEESFSHLRELLIQEARIKPVIPIPSAQADQIVWGRSPVRLDLAGGWTDTPPYCLQHGGRVVNVAVDLNGQPPVQVFAKLSRQPYLVIRSIDLGLEQRIQTYKELDTYQNPSDPFALAKAALALAGFLPRFYGGTPFGSLGAQLKDFGWGIEISLLAAVPKGSGLGTSSILASTLLSTLSSLCGLEWDKHALVLRTLVLEQMLTTGGGWQDQAGAIFHGLKLIETEAGLAQKPSIRWLPDTLFGPTYSNQTILLYYTGITRMAKRILYEIVRGFFLNSTEHLETVAAIGQNADFAYQACQRCDYDQLCEAVRRSWDLNRRLDVGTNPPEIQSILNGISDYLQAAKLLGAGGGGFLMLMAKDEGAARLIKEHLTQNPPNPQARFSSISLSQSGLQITRS